MNRRDGFSLIEIIAVIVIIATLVSFALNKLWPLFGKAERAHTLQMIGGLRSALTLNMAERIVNDQRLQWETYRDKNPVSYLAAPPGNYLGAFDHLKPSQMKKGSWYFDKTQHLLIYRVRFAQYFHSPLPGPARIRLKIMPIFGKNKLYAVDLKAVDPYQWVFR